jgi:hypothetical protein
MVLTNFNVFSYSTIADAVYTIYSKGEKTASNSIARPNFSAPRPCFGFIWGNFSNSVRTNNSYTVDYATNVYINRNIDWAMARNLKNYCALTDKEIEIYLEFVAKIAGDKFTIKKTDFSDGKASDCFNGIIVNVEAKDVPFKHVMVVCNLIRYMYEWPEAYNIKQMMAALENELFYDDFGRIFCLFETYIRNTYDQKVSFCSTQGPSFIPIQTVEEMAARLQDMNVSLQASNYLEFVDFQPEMKVCISNGSAPNMWNNNKHDQYRSALYLDNKTSALDPDLIKNISKLYRFILMNECLTK